MHNALKYLQVYVIAKLDRSSSKASITLDNIELTGEHFNTFNMCFYGSGANQFNFRCRKSQNLLIMRLQLISWIKTFRCILLALYYLFILFILLW